ncbi:RNA polymerase sigma-70 factor [Puteibacter caeruleilacunae]|nr:RNA polymerase sigma-70 factor [Puteibacter caeruleilacunae]
MNQSKKLTLTYLNVDIRGLIAKLNTGDIQAFEAIYRLYAKRVFALAMRIIQNSDQAELLVQDTFVKVWNMRGKIKSDTSFDTYIFTICKNLVINKMHELNRMRELIELKDNLNELEEVNNADTPVEEIQRLNKLIDAMPERRRKIFIMSKRDGYTYNEIASSLGLSVKTVENQISSAYKFLREGLTRINIFF